MDITISAYQKALEVLKKVSTPKGFYAASPGYQGVWARDSMITSLGASLIPEEKFKESFKNSLLTLSKYQSSRGQVPNAIIPKSSRFNKPQVDFQSIDSSLWFVIGHYIYRNRYKESSLFKKHAFNIHKAMNFVYNLDMGEDSMPEQQPTTDWQDAFPHRYGHTINTQALYFKVLTFTKNKQEASLLKKTVNKKSDVSLWDSKLGYYLPWRWKNHNKYQEKGEWFDTLGNLLAIIFELADNSQSNKILSHIKKSKIDSPFPIKSIYPPIKPGSKDWQPYFNDSNARTPYHYSNAGIWTFIGGIYILALIKQKKFKEAEKQLTKLAEANLQKPEFAEWLNGKTGKPGNSHSSSQEGNQAWNAGMYILAFESLKQKKVLI
jgi:hypothetical protein